MASDIVSPSRRIPLSQRVGNVEEGLLRVEAKLDDVGTRVDGFGLNGSGPVIRDMAAFWRQHGEKFAALGECAPALIALASERADAAAFWRTLQRRLRWGKGTKTAVQTIGTAVLTMAVYYLATLVFHLPWLGPGSHP